MSDDNRRFVDAKRVGEITANGPVVSHDEPALAEQLNELIADRALRIALLRALEWCAGDDGEQCPTCGQINPAHGEHGGCLYVFGDFGHKPDCKLAEALR